MRNFAAETNKSYQISDTWPGGKCHEIVACYPKQPIYFKGKLFTQIKKK